MDAHGETIVTCDGRIIQSTFIGSFNSVGVQDYANKIKSIVMGLDGATFAILVDDLALEGGTPHAYQVLDAYYQWLNQQPLVAKAMVTKSLISLKIINGLAPSHQEQNIRHFTDHDEALAWLRSEIARSDKEMSNSDNT